ncbi:MAG TPA: hypothetical protein VGG72_20025 [Bryobacteraceae bacterium]|jgi:hypothetical protein
MTEKPATHIAYALQRENPADPFRRERRVKAYWIEIGNCWIESAGAPHRIFLNRLPTGGFTGHLYLWPVGVIPPEPEAQPERPMEEGVR